MFGEHFILNEHTLSIIDSIGMHMPGGFFIYKGDGTDELLYANRAVIDLFGCESQEDFKELTGYSLKGMLHPDDYRMLSEASRNRNPEARSELEYRIIRKDGSVRFVESFGHFTENIRYGGIWYAFVSDITEKREQMESDLAVRQAVIRALSESYHTVWLINDVETGTFSLYRGDTEGQTVHTGPIRDALKQMKYPVAKDEYIRSVVAPSDRERLQEELDLGNIAARMREKPQFSVNYLRTMGDGSERYYRIEFAKCNMPGGKMGIVCGFKDVDDDVREGQALQRARQAEMEQRIALQEKLLEEERHRAEQDKLITALASDYRGVYYCELDTDEGVCYQVHSELAEGFKVGQHFPFLQGITDYGHKYVAASYLDEFLQFIRPETIRAGLKTERLISFTYIVNRNGRESYEAIRFAGVRHPEDRDDGIVHAVSMCFANVDAETRKRIAETRALSEALTAANEANRAKTAFLSNMSHEIRTPMNAIIGLDNIALKNPDLQEETRAHLEKIGFSAQHLLNIINDILDMSRIESGRMTIRHEEFSFANALEQVNTIIAGQCGEKGLHYEYTVRDGLDDYYVGDDMKLRQILINLLGNAVKFTPAGGTVSFLAEKAASFDKKTTVRFVVRDTGIGMSADYLPKIFDAFSQEEASATKYGSTGLGMPITKSLVEMMNGSIDVVSEKGAGTTFTVTVTLADAERNDHEREEDEPDRYPHDLTALVIGGEPAVCEQAEFVLGEAGIHCEMASSCTEGAGMSEVRRARREPYHLILIERKAADADLAGTVREIRDIAGNEAVIMILSGGNPENAAEEAEAAGADSFVAEPLCAAEVMEKFTLAYKKKQNVSAGRKKDLKGCRILLAEDMDVNAEILMMILAMKEIEAERAENGQAAADLFAGSVPGYYDAILMDMRMPVKDGLTATKEIRAMDREDAGTIPIIALTANAFDEDVQRSMQAGLNAHLSKPVEPKALFETLESLIR